jgi:hypothetical protein
MKVTPLFYENARAFSKAQQRVPASLFDLGTARIASVCP